MYMCALLMREPLPDEARLQDICVSKKHDLGSVRGFVRAVEATLSIREGGVLWLGVPCSTFVWMSRSTYRRTAASPFGRLSNKTVVEANMLLLRSILLGLLATTRRVYICFEQPLSSTLRHIPHMNLLSGACGAQWSHISTCRISI